MMMADASRPSTSLVLGTGHVLALKPLGGATHPTQADGGSTLGSVYIRCSVSKQVSNQESNFYYM